MSINPSDIEKILALLEGERGLYESLLVSGKREREALIGSNIDELNRINKEKEDLISKAHTVEGQRSSVIHDLAGSLGCPKNELTVTRLTQLVEEPWSTRLESLRSSILETARDLTEVNEGNRDLFEHSLGLLRSSLRFLENLVTSNTVYYGSGKMHTNDQSGRVFSGQV